MVMVRISETYDLSTKVDKMGLIGIHTPDLNLLRKYFGGLMQNHKYVRAVACDVSLACASLLPADPLQVGVDAGEIAPQDMFNPLLYRAVSNDSFNTILARIYNSHESFYGGTWESVNEKNPMLSDNVSLGTAGDGVTLTEFDIYYGLLSQDGWKKAMPQSGLSMKGLYPIVYSVVDNYGNMKILTSEGNAITSGINTVNNLANGVSVNNASMFRGPSMRMPAVPLHYSMNAAETPEIPRTYVAAIITPPAKLHKLYYRMRVTWTYELTGIIPLTDYAGFADMAAKGHDTYGTDYQFQSSKMGETTEMVDTRDVDIEMIMGSGK